ncbi:MAG: VirB4-like conjugal transfer ATPase, CD1110 family [Chloroflexota bacterium]
MRPWSFPHLRPMHFRRSNRSRPPSSAVEEQRLALGARSLADFIAPAAVEVARNHVRLEHQYVRVLAVTGYPRTVSPGWLDALLAFAEPIEVSLHLTPLASRPMIATLTHKLVGLDSSRVLADRQGRLSDPERETAYADADQLREALQRGDERLFSVSLYVQIRATSPTALDALTQQVEGALAGILAQSRVALWEQDRAFRSCLPQGQDHLGIYHNLDTSSVATMFPFSSSNLTMPRGLLYGIATKSHAPVMVDPFDASLDNSNLTIFATSGAGKSYFCKLLLLRALLQGIDAIIIDPEDEYRALCQAVDGQYVRLASTSPHQINPFDLPPPDPTDREGRDPLAEQVTAVTALLELLLTDADLPLGAHERGLLDRAIYQTYATAGIHPGIPASYTRPAPLLRDLHAVLAASTDPATRRMADDLQRYVQGALAGLFAGPTNVALDRPCVVFNLQALETELRPVGIHLVTNFVWRQVRRQRRPRLLVVDEAWSLLQYPQGAAFLAGMARRARKYSLGLVTITQDVADALATPHGRTVLTNAASSLLLKQSASTIETVANAFALSSEERQYLLAAPRGEGLFCCRGARVALRVAASPREHTLATTAPQDLAARDAAETPVSAVPSEETFSGAAPFAPAAGGR